MDLSASTILLGLTLIAVGVCGAVAVYLRLHGDAPAARRADAAVPVTDTGRHHVPAWLIDGETARLGPDVLRRSRQDRPARPIP